MKHTITLFDRDGVEELADLRDRPRRLRGSMLLWVDVLHPTVDGVGPIADEFALDEETRERLGTSGGGTYFLDKGHYIHITASAPATRRGCGRTGRDRVRGR